MEEIINLITNQGFAIAMCTYVIVVLNKSVQENTRAITILSERLEKEENR